MSVLSGFFRASYSINGKRATFFARRADIPELGRRSTIHNYPNSNNTYVEDQGKISGKYTLEIEIQETTASAYKRSRNALMTALEQQGVGSLTHPTLGKKKVVPIPSSMSEDFITQNGVVGFKITFLESTLNIFPESTTGNKGFLSGLYDKTFGDSETVFGQALNYYDQGIELFNQGRDYLQDATNNIDDVVSTANGVADEVAAFSADVKDLSSSIITLMQTPADLARRFTGIFNGISTITDDFQIMTDIVLQIFGSGDRTKTDGNSNLTNQLNNNKIATADYIDVACLTIAYLATTNIDYTSQDQIDDMLLRLNTAFDTLDPDSVNEDVYYDLQEMRTQNRLLLQDLKTTLPFYVTIKTNPVSSSVLAYNLYGDSSRSSEIDSLNGVEDPAFVSGSVITLSN